MRKIRLALIEDDDLTRMGLGTAFQSWEEFELIGEASNGKEGLKLLQSLQPDIAIIDIGLPELDGIELTRQFRASQSIVGVNGTKILILTLRDEPEEVLAALAAGADSYCMKDTRLELLLEALKVTHEGNAWIDPAIARIVISQIIPSPSPLNQPAKINPPQSQPRQLLENHPLTDREMEVLQLIVDGYSNAAIAQKLFITVGTVKTHVRNILNKLSADDRTQAAVQALRSGLIV